MWLGRVIEWERVHDVRVRILTLLLKVRGLHIAFCLSFGLVAIPCFDGGDRPPSGIPHPNEDNRPPLHAAVITGNAIPSGLSLQATTAWLHVKRSLLEAEPVLRLGSHQSGPTAFGRISAAKIASNGDIVVLDADAQEVRVFDAVGGYLDGFGGWGDGPTELRRASDFHVFRDGRIAVALGKTGPVKFFQRSGDRWMLTDVIDLKPTPAHSLCGMDDGRLFSAGYLRRDDTILNELSEDVRSFGHGYKHTHPFIRSALSDGVVECLEKPERVVFGFSTLPIVRSYRVDGSLQWTATVPDYVQLQVFETRHPETGAVGYSTWSSRDHDQLARLHAVGSGDHLLVQYDRVSQEQRDVVRSYLVDAVTGIGASLDESLPEVLSVQPDGYIVLFEEPYPHLEVRKDLKPVESD